MARILAILVLLSGSLAGRSQVYHSCPRLPQGEAYENPLEEKWLSAFDVKYCHLSLEVSNKNTRISGAAQVLLETVRDMDTLVLELGEPLNITSVLLADDPLSSFFDAGNELAFDHVQDAVYIKLDRTRHPGELVLVRIEYGGEAGRDRGFFAGINSERETVYGFDVTYTLSEPYHASDWFPVKQVLSDKIDSVTFELTCSKELMAGSNGLLVQVEDEGKTHRMTWKTGYPMAYYLLSFAVADYMDYSFYAPLPGTGDSVLVQNYLYDTEAVLERWKEQIDETGPLITLFSTLLADYPFAAEKYGHSMAPLGGGMEHQTMTTISGFNFSLVAHELAHQWFGDLVTCGNWQDIWINEGFASYMEYVAAQYLRDQETADGWMENAMSISLGAPEGSVYVPQEEVEDTYRLFDGPLSYKKGAILLHMIRFILDDDDLFFQVLQTYLSRYKNSTATGAGFQSVLEEVSGMDFSCFFQQWYYGEGYPVFKIFWEQQGDKLLLRSEQTGTVSEITPLFQVPFELDIWYVGGQKQRVRLMQQDSEQEWNLPLQGTVERVEFDPENHLLKTATVIQRIPEDQYIRFGPNPVSGKLIVQIPNTMQIEAIRITNLSGQEIYRDTEVENPLTLDLSTYEDGPYLLELTSASRSYLERIVKISSE
jgi:aminopeptidase N